MYTLAVRREFTARHFLIGGDWGAENLPHSHDYVLELQLEGYELNEHGYLVDIVDVENHLAEVIRYYRDQMLNDKSEFAGMNPSLERFARILTTTLDERILALNILVVRVVLWETADAWASYTLERPRPTL